MNRDTAPVEAPTTEAELREQIEGLKKEVQRLVLFHDIGKQLAGTLDLQRILQTIMEKIHDLLTPDSWSLLLLDEKTRELSFEIAVGDGADSLKNVKLKVGEGLAGWTAQHGEALLIEDAPSDPRFDPRFDEMTGTTTRSVVCVPIKGRDSVLGVIELVNFIEKRSFRDTDVPVLSNLADYAAIAIDNARYVNRIHELTITDDCTTLYNARHLHFVLEAEIYRSSRYGYEFSLIFLDLDHFKDINDTHGHVVGSKMLFQVGELLKKHIRLIDTAFRYGGDEFVILLPQTTKPEALKAVRRLRELLNAQRFLADESLGLAVTASFGVAAFPEDGKTRKDLLESSDEAMYRVKNSSRDDIALARGPRG